MVNGILEVELVDARGLQGANFIGEGCNPVWNERFKFRVQYPVEDDQCKLFLRIMDKDTFSADDFLGEAKIYLKDLIAMGVENGGAQLHPHKYSVVKPDQTYCGEMRVGLTFTPSV